MNLIPCSLVDSHHVVGALHVGPGRIPKIGLIVHEPHMLAEHIIMGLSETERNNNKSYKEFTNLCRSNEFIPDNYKAFGSFCSSPLTLGDQRFNNLHNRGLYTSSLLKNLVKYWKYPLLAIRIRSSQY